MIDIRRNSPHFSTFCLLPSMIIRTELYLLVVVWLLVATTTGTLDKHFHPPDVKHRVEPNVGLSDNQQTIANRDNLDASHINLSTPERQKSGANPLSEPTTPFSQPQRILLVNQPISPSHVRLMHNIALQLQAKGHHITELTYPLTESVGFILLPDFLYSF